MDNKPFVYGEDNFYITIEFGNGNKIIGKNKDLFKICDALPLIVLQDLMYRNKEITEKETYRVSKRHEEYENNYHESVYELNKEYDDWLNEQMYGK